MLGFPPPKISTQIPVLAPSHKIPNPKIPVFQLEQMTAESQSSLASLRSQLEEFQEKSRRELTDSQKIAQDREAEAEKFQQNLGKLQDEVCWESELSFPGILRIFWENPAGSLGNFGVFPAGFPAERDDPGKPGRAGSDPAGQGAAAAEAPGAGAGPGKSEAIPGRASSAFQGTGGGDS